MTLEPDFIDDSTEVPEEETPDGHLFVTEASLVPSGPLPPAVDVVPITSLCRRVVSSVTSLILFGDSEIGITIPGNVYELGRQAEVALSEFPKFIQRSERVKQSPEQILARKYIALKAAIDREKVRQSGLRARLRGVNAQFKKIERADAVGEAGHWVSAMRATGLGLNDAVTKIQNEAAALRKLQEENAEIEKDIDGMIRGQRKMEGGDVKAGILKQVSTMTSAAFDRKAVCAEIEGQIADLKGTIGGMERREGDLLQRIIVNKPRLPKRIVKPLKLKIKRGWPLPPMGIAKPRFVHL
jgi:hypothetical protein